VAIAFEFVERSIAGPEAHPKCSQAASPWNACTTKHLTLNFAEESNPATQGKVQAPSRADIFCNAVFFEETRGFGFQSV
jgi:hypothetical protein